MLKNFPDHSKISPTAKVVAYWRQFSNIPFADEVAEMVNSEEVFKGFLKNTDLSLESLSWFAPMIEARYKSMISAIHRQNIKQVLELASGVSLRGLAMTSDPDVIYVETDLPGMSTEKKKVVQKIRESKNISERNNLFFREVNVMSLNELQEATHPFSKERPIAIIHEGLFQYLSLEEKKIAASHFHSLLNRFGGVWMTPDLNTKADFEKNKNVHMKEIQEAIGNATERSFRDSAFENDDHLREFFENLGFEVQEFPQMDGTFELSSVKKLNISQETLASYISDLKLWCLRVKPRRYN